MNFEIILNVVSLFITNSILKILTPLISLNYKSVIFVIFVIGFGYALIFCLIFIFIIKGHLSKIKLPDNFSIIIQCGLFNALANISLFYSSHPNRTPPVFQSILFGLSILFSVILTKFLLLHKKIKYEKKFIFPSILFLIVSLILPSINHYSEWNLNSIGWILFYIFGVFSVTTFN